MDQAVDYKHALANPGLYGTGLRGERYNVRIFLIYVAEAILSGLILVLCFAQLTPVMNFQGYGFSFEAFSLSAVTAAILVANVFVGLNTYSWNWIMHLFIWGSILLTLIAPFFFMMVPTSPLYGVAYIMYGSPKFWFMAALVLVLLLGPRWIFMSVKHVFYPSDIDLIREQQVYNCRDKPLSRSVSHLEENVPNVTIPNPSVEGRSDTRPPRIASFHFSPEAAIVNVDTQSVHNSSPPTTPSANSTDFGIV